MDNVMTLIQMLTIVVVSILSKVVSIALALSEVISMSLINPKLPEIFSNHLECKGVVLYRFCRGFNWNSHQGQHCQHYCQMPWDCPSYPSTSGTPTHTSR